MYSIYSPSPIFISEHTKILALNLQSGNSPQHLGFTLKWEKCEMWNRTGKRKEEGGQHEWLLCSACFTSTVLQFVVNTYAPVGPGCLCCRCHSEQTCWYIMQLEEKQTENCQHRWSYEEEQMIKSVRFNNKLTTSVLFLSPSPLVDGRKSTENREHRQLSTFEILQKKYSLVKCWAGKDLVSLPLEWLLFVDGSLNLPLWKVKADQLTILVPQNTSISTKPQCDHWGSHLLDIPFIYY